MHLRISHLHLYLPGHIRRGNYTLTND